MCVGVSVNVTLSVPPGDTLTWLEGLNAMSTPGGIISTDRSTVAASPIEFTLIIVDPVSPAAIGGIQSGSAFIVNDTSVPITWNGFMMYTG